jgi:hypothetical protein
LAVATTVGFGLTVIVNVLIGPAQALAIGVIVMVFTIGAEPVFVAVKAGRLPVPEVGVIPKVGVVSLLQVYKVPKTPFEVLNAVNGTNTPLQYTWLLTAAKIGSGFTVIVKLTGDPPQPLAVGVTVIVPVIFAFVELVV